MPEFVLGRVPWTIYPVFTKEEADGFGYQYVKWFEAAPGYKGLVLSDDGYVLMANNVSRTFRKSKERHLVLKTRAGYARVSRDAMGHLQKPFNVAPFLPYEIAKDAYNPITKAERQSRRWASTKKLWIFAKWIYQNPDKMPPRNLKETAMEVMEMAGETSKYRRGAYINLVKGYFLMQDDKRIVNAVNDKVRALMEAEGTTSGWAVNKRRELVEEAIKNKNYTEANKALDKFDKWNELDMPTVTQVHTAEATKVIDLQGRVKEEKLKLSQRSYLNGTDRIDSEDENRPDETGD